MFVQCLLRPRGTIETSAGDMKSHRSDSISLSSKTLTISERYRPIKDYSATWLGNEALSPHTSTDRVLSSLRTATNSVNGENSPNQGGKNHTSLLASLATAEMPAAFCLALSHTFVLGSSNDNHTLKHQTQNHFAKISERLPIPYTDVTIFFLI